MKIIAKNFIVAACALVVSLGLCFVIMAWSEPGAMPPEGNISAPINTEVISQTKSGGLNILGNIGIGVPAPAGNGKICLNGECVSTWKEFVTVGAKSTCVLKTCAGLGKNCGTVSDGCGGTLNCGNCAANQTCTANVCVNNCVPGCNGRCGYVVDGCSGNDIYCGVCRGRHR